MNSQIIKTVRTLMNAKPAGEQQVFEELEYLFVQCLAEALATADQKNGSDLSVSAPQSAH